MATPPLPTHDFRVRRDPIRTCGRGQGDFTADGATPPGFAFFLFLFCLSRVGPSVALDSGRGRTLLCVLGRSLPYNCVCASRVGSCCHDVTALPAPSVSLTRAFHHQKPAPSSPVHLFLPSPPSLSRATVSSFSVCGSDSTFRWFSFALNKQVSLSAQRASADALARATSFPRGRNITRARSSTPCL